jgi:hypothetical protein
MPERKSPEVLAGADLDEEAVYANGEHISSTNVWSRWPRNQYVCRRRRMIKGVAIATNTGGR